MWFQVVLEMPVVVRQLRDWSLVEERERRAGTELWTQDSRIRISGINNSKYSQVFIRKRLAALPVWEVVYCGNEWEYEPGLRAEQSRDCR